VSLRKSPQLSPQLLDAARSNAQQSTGPRTDAGKQNSKMNAVCHGERSDPRNDYWVMLALGEDPEKFEFLKRHLMLSYGPGEPLWQNQIDDLARLYWRRDRMQRAQEGVMRRARLAVEERQHHRRQELAEATFDAAQAQDLNRERPAPTDPGVRLRWRLSWLKVIREQVKQRAFEPWHVCKIESLCQENMGWRQARLAKLLRLFAAAVPSAPGEEQGEPCEGAAVGARHGMPLQETEEQYQELLRLLEEEVAWVQEEFEYAEKVNEEKVSIERDACLAPEGDQWQMMLRREAALDRSIDRKVRILLHMRKEYQAYRNTPVPDGVELDEDVAEILGLDLPSEEPVTPKASPGDVAPLTAADAGTSSPRSHPENPTPRKAGGPHPREEKMNERTGKVIENKGIGCTTQPTITALGHQHGEPLSRREGNLPVYGV